jgi:hypothetical protein
VCLCVCVYIYLNTLAEVPTADVTDKDYGIYTHAHIYIHACMYT